MNNFLQVGRNSSVTQTSRILLEHSSFLPRSVYYRLKIFHDRRIPRTWIATREKYPASLSLIKLLTNEGAPPYSCPSRVSSTGTNMVRSPSSFLAVSSPRFSFSSSSSCHWPLSGHRFFLLFSFASSSLFRRAAFPRTSARPTTE